MKHIEEILEKMEDILDNSKTIPFSDKVAVDRDEFLNLITEIRLKLPNEIEQSKWVIEERNKIIVQAKKEAEVKLKDAEFQREHMVNEHEITQRAYDQSEKIIETAKKVSKDMRMGAKEYADELLGEIENNLNEMLKISQDNFSQFTNLLERKIEIIEDNRQELDVK